MVKDDKGNLLKTGDICEDPYRAGINHYCRIQTISGSSLTLKYPNQRTVSIDLENQSVLPLIKLTREEIQNTKREYQQIADFLNPSNLESSLTQP